MMKVKFKDTLTVVLGAALPLAAATLVFACKGDRSETASETGEPPEARQGLPEQQAEPTTGTDQQEQPARGTEPPQARGMGQPPTPAETGAPGTDPGAGAPSVSDKKVDQFARALVEVRDVSDKYSGEISSAGSTEKAQALQKEAMQEIEEKVSEAGLDMAEYERIASAVKAQPALQAKVQSKIEAME